MTIDNKPWLIFDYDDTLGGVEFPDGSIRSSADAYFDVIEKFLAYMDDLGFDREKARTTQTEIDEALIYTYGFGTRGRFAQSMVDTFLAMGGKGMEHQVALHSIGMSVFNHYPYHALPGALTILEEYAPYYNIAVVTKGEFGEQHKKLRDSGVYPYLQYEHVTSQKTQGMWTSVVRTDLGLTNDSMCAGSWAIGNSAGADVNPLLALGFNGIHVTGYNRWEYEQAELAEPMEGRMAVALTDIIDMPLYVPFLFTRQVGYEHRDG